MTLFSLCKNTDKTVDDEGVSRQTGEYIDDAYLLAMFRHIPNMALLYHFDRVFMILEISISEFTCRLLSNAFTT
jgi:hypothetical protein